jgi:hypothetical protein
VTASVARSPESNAISVDLRSLLQIGNRTTPVADLLPGVDILSRFATTVTEIAMVVQQHDEPGLGERLCKALEAVILRAGIAVGHRNGRQRSSPAFQHEQPSRYLDPAFGGETDVVFVLV